MARPHAPIRVERRLASYLRTHLAPALNLPGGFEEVERTSERPHAPVFMIRPEGAPAFALRLVGDPGRGERLARAARLAESAGLPTPRLIHSDFSRAHFREHGFGVIVEEALTGESPARAETTDAHRGALAEALARVHAVESTRWGPPGRFQFRVYFEGALARRLERRLRWVQTLDDSFRPEWRETILQFIREERARWSIPGPFALTHDKIHPGNVIFAPDGRAQLVDLRGVAFGSVGKDLAAALSFYCATPEQTERFKETYFALVHPRWREHYARHEAVYQVSHHLNRWLSRSREALAARNGDESSREERRQSRKREREALWMWLNRAA